ncbi:F-box protein At1g22220 isoform X2 [Cucumis sativus]|uniref:F-box protein At1g22220 isoform X2 n=1 Tax=Cucumis sativus TaxID=3659 RepID=UPI0012F4FF80|nr:F-box protein At1g22220 isoform X2 [Cucumis sativus]
MAEQQEREQQQNASSSSSSSSPTIYTNDADAFESLPDSLILLIFNSVSDVKTLIRCRAVSKRFNSLVPHSDSLSLKVDCVISSDSDSDSHQNSFLLSFFKSVLKSFLDLLSPILLQSESQNSPAQILRQFRRIQHLQIEFPTTDLKVERVVKWRAEFGDALKSCVILIFREIRKGAIEEDDVDSDLDFIGGLKSKVFMTISTVITASARHHVLGEVVEEHLEMESLALRDRGGEGVVVMEKKGLEELRRWRMGDGGEVAEWRRTRTRVPSTTVRMRHKGRVEVRRGMWMEDATLVVVKPSGNGRKSGDGEVDKEDAEVAVRAFEGDDVYREAVEALLRKGKRQR